MDNYKQEILIGKLRDLRDQFLQILHESEYPEMIGALHYTVYGGDENRPAVLDAFSIGNMPTEGLVSNYISEVSNDLHRIRSNGDLARYSVGSKVVCTDSRGFDNTFKDTPVNGKTYTIKDVLRSFLSNDIYFKFEEIDAGPKQVGYRDSHFMNYEAFKKGVIRSN